MVNLTLENKEVIRKYYYDMYELKLKIKGMDNPTKIEEAQKFIDSKIDLYLSGTSTVSFSRYLSNSNHRARNLMTISISINELLQEFKKGDIKNLEYIIRYYQIMNEFTINTKYSYLSDKEKIIDSSNKYIDEAIRKYILKGSQSDFVNHVNYVVIPSFFAKQGLFKIKDIELIYQEFFDKVIKKISYNGILKEGELQNFIRVYLKDKIDNYIENNLDDKLKLSNYMGVVALRIREFCKDEERILIEYNRYYENRYDDTINYFYCKYRYLVNDVIKEQRLNIRYVLKYELKFKDIIKDYVDHNINSKLKLDKNILKDAINDMITKDMKKESKFDYYLARNGSKEDKRMQKNILIEELQYMKDDFKEKYIFYTDKDNVDEKMDLFYKSAIKGYVEGESSKNVKAYVWTRMNQGLKKFSESAQKSFNKSNLKNIYRKKAFNIVNAYVKYNNLFGEELNMFLDYCNDVFNNFINKGTYDDVCSYMIEAIMVYDANLTNEISHLKNKCLK